MARAASASPDVRQPLDNPQLFEHDFFGAIRDEELGSIADIQRGIRDLLGTAEDLRQDREEIIAALSAENLSDEEAADLAFEIQKIDARVDEDAGLGDTEGLTESQVAELEDALANNIPAIVEARYAVLEDPEGLLAQRDAILDSMQGAIAKGYLPDLDEKRAAVENSDGRDIELEFALTTYIAQDSSRLAQIGWGGDLRGYLTTTLIHGRPGSANVYPGSKANPDSPVGGMVAWSQQAGGPLRQDQIDNIVNYILNWDKGDNWTLQDLNNVQQYAILHGDAGKIGSGVIDEPPETVTPSDDPRFIAVSELTGDAANGEVRYAATGCIGCHAGGAVGPATTGTWARVEADRLTLDEFADYTVAGYIYESITNPNAFVAEGYAPGVMPQNLGDLLSDQDIADIMAYLETQ